MELGKVIFSDSILDSLEDLVFILFEKDYFSYKENAFDYVDKIIDYVTNDIHAFPHKKTPKKLSRLGSNYFFYKSNTRTTWFIFFEQKSTHYYISGILNNHCEEASELEFQK